MTPEETLNKQVWEILKDIKEEVLVTVDGQPTKYRVAFVAGVGIIPRDRKIQILYKLEELGAFKISRNTDGDRIGTDDLFYLIIEKPKFDEIYQKYQEVCDLQSYLDNYQRSVFEGKPSPVLFKVEKKHDHNSTETNQSRDLKERYAKLLEEITTRGKKAYAPNPIDAEQIVANFSERNLPLALFVLERIRDAIELAPANRSAKYMLKGPSGTQRLIKERLMLEKLASFGLFKKGEEDGLFGISTIADWDLPLIKQCIEKIHHILQLPASVNTQKTPATNEPKTPTGEGWSLEESERGACIKYNGEEKYRGFDSKETLEFKYLKYLWGHQGVFVQYSALHPIYLKNKGISAEALPKNFKINDCIRRAIGTLKKKLVTKGRLPFKFDIDRGVTFTIEKQNS